MTTPASVNEPPLGVLTVGEQLRAARVARGWSVANVATSLHIRPALVEALEQGDYAAFLAAAYARGQLRNYARLTGLDERALLAQFEVPPLGPAGRPLHRTPELHPRRPWLVRLGGFAVVSALIVLGALWARSDGPLQPPAYQPLTVIQSAPQPPAEAPLPGAATASGVGVETPPAVDGMAVGNAPAAAPAQAEAPPPASMEPLPQDATPPIPEPAPAAAAMAELRLRTRAVSWVEVTDHQGQRLVYDLLGPDRERVVRGEPPLRLLLGNAPAVDVVFAGAPVTLPAGEHVVRMTLGTAADSPSP